MKWKGLIPASVSAPFLEMSEQMVSSCLVEGLWGVRDWARRPARQSLQGCEK